MEGSLRVPFVMRWPGKIAAGRVSNDIVHEVDTFTTLVKLAGGELPNDRAIDGVDQADFLQGLASASARKGFPVFVADRMEAIKWDDCKLSFYDEQGDWWTPPAKMGVPKLFNLVNDPKEEYPQLFTENTWVIAPMFKTVGSFQGSMKQYPPISPGTPAPYQPPR